MNASNATGQCDVNYETGAGAASRSTGGNSGLGAEFHRDERDQVSGAGGGERT